MKFLIAGLGSIGRRHFRNLLALGETDIVLLRSHRSTLSDDELVGYPVETDIHEALQKHKPDAVIVANPTALHLDVAILAAEAGCHLLLEKPVSNTLTRVDELSASVKRKQVQVMVAFQFRFHPTLQKAAELLGEGAIGEVSSVRAHWGEYLPNWHPWEDYRQGYAARADLGGGVTRTLSHPLDYLRMLLGDVDALWALTSSKNLDLPVDDASEIGLRFESGAIGSVHLNYNQQPPVHRLEIVGAEGSLRWDNADGALHLYRASSAIWEVFTPPDGFERNDLFIAEMQHFINTIQGNEQSRCTLDDGIAVQRLVDAVYRSSEEQALIRL